MDKEVVIRARDVMARFLKEDREYEKIKEKYKEHGLGDSFEDAIKKMYTSEELERFDEIKLCQRLNMCFTPTKSEKNVYVCLGAYYNGMGPNRVECKRIFESTPLSKNADILYYINIANYSDRKIIPIEEAKEFEGENIIIHLNNDNKVKNNFIDQEGKYEKIRMFYLLELLKANLDDKPNKIRDNILIKVRQNMKK